MIFRALGQLIVGIFQAIGDAARERRRKRRIRKAEKKRGRRQNLGTK